MDFYENSNHNRYCLLDSKAIVEQRRTTNETAKTHIPPDLEPLSPEEELLIIKHYHTKIPETCRYFKFPPSVAPYAHWLFTRLSLRLSVMDYDPKHTMLACVLLATKLSDLHLTMEQFVGKIPNTDRELLVRLEFVLLASFEYRLHFFDPHLALAGFILDFQGQFELDEAIIKGATVLLDHICATDAILILPPSHLALVALSRALNNPCLFSDYLQTRQKQLSVASDDLAQWHSTIDEFLSKMTVDLETVRAIDRRLINIRKHHSAS